MMFRPAKLRELADLLEEWHATASKFDDAGFAVPDPDFIDDDGDPLFAIEVDDRGPYVRIGA